MLGFGRDFHYPDNNVNGSEYLNYIALAPVRPRSVSVWPTPPVQSAKARQHPGRCLLEALRDREHDVLLFVFDTAVPPMNSQAERDLRPWKDRPEDLRTTPIRKSPPPAHHPRLHLYRSQTRHQLHGRVPHCHRRRPGDATHLCEYVIEPNNQGDFEVAYLG
jgi:hypothetical protein